MPTLPLLHAQEAEPNTESAADDYVRKPVALPKLLRLLLPRDELPD